MTEYLSYQMIDDEAFINTFDEAPLWSASFGLLLLKHLAFKKHSTVLDIGSGAGFPLMELAGRLGPTCKLTGIDPWTNANQRARQKIKDYAYSNVDIIEQSAEQIPFEDNSVDLIVSNLGINNFNQPQRVFNECTRVLKQGGKLALTTNLNGHWKEFYTIFESTLLQLNLSDSLEKLTLHQEHRGTVESISNMILDSELKPSRTITDSFEMMFTDGSAFLNHHFVKLGWLSSWKDLLPEDRQIEIFTLLEENLNAYAETHEGLNLTVPMAFIEAEK